MIEVITLLSLVTGWLLFQLVQSLIDYVIELSAKGFVGSLVAYNIMRVIL